MSNRNIEILMLPSSVSESVSISLPYSMQFLPCSYWSNHDSLLEKPPPPTIYPHCLTDHGFGYWVA